MTLMPTVCGFCGEPVYNDRVAHPCCVFWDELRPGRPCLACSESKRARRPGRWR